MKLEEAYALAEALTEERNGGKNNSFKVELGENEGENIPHFHYIHFIRCVKKVFN